MQLHLRFNLNSKNSQVILPHIALATHFFSQLSISSSFFKRISSALPVLTPLTSKHTHNGYSCNSQHVRPLFQLHYFWHAHLCTSLYTRFIHPPAAIFPVLIFIFSNSFVFFHWSSLPRVEYNYLVKVVVVGDSGVGKSCLLKRFVDDTFETNYLSTIGVDFHVKNIPVDDKVAKLQLWDTAGQERFQTITSTYFRGAHAVAVVVDMTDRLSFDHVPKWVDQILSYSPQGVPIVLIANKSDLASKRVISQEELEEMATRMSALQSRDMERGSFCQPIKVLETSAKTYENVESAFSTIARQYISMFHHLRKQNHCLNDSGKKKPLIIGAPIEEKLFKCCTIL